MMLSAVKRADANCDEIQALRAAHDGFRLSTWGGMVGGGGAAAVGIGMQDAAVARQYHSLTRPNKIPTTMEEYRPVKAQARALARKTAGHVAGRVLTIGGTAVGVLSFVSFLADGYRATQYARALSNPVMGPLIRKPHLLLEMSESEACKKVEENEFLSLAVWEEISRTKTFTRALNEQKVKGVPVDGTRVGKRESLRAQSAQDRAARAVIRPAHFAN